MMSSIFCGPDKPTGLVISTLTFLFYLMILMMLHLGSPSYKIDEEKIKIFITDRECDLKPGFKGNFLANQISCDQEVCYLINVKKETNFGIEFQYLYFEQCFKNYNYFDIMSLETFAQTSAGSTFIGYWLYIVAYFSSFKNLKREMIISIDNFIQALCIPIFVGILCLIIFF